MRNLIDAEEAAKVEVAAMKNAAADPFTRRQCRPTMVTRVSLFLFYFVFIFLAFTSYILHILMQFVCIVGFDWLLFYVKFSI